MGYNKRTMHSITLTTNEMRAIILASLHMYEFFGDHDLYSATNTNNQQRDNVRNILIWEIAEAYSQKKDNHTIKQLSILDLNIIVWFLLHAPLENRSQKIGLSNEEYDGLLSGLNSLMPSKNKGKEKVS